MTPIRRVRLSSSSRPLLQSPPSIIEAYETVGSNGIIPGVSSDPNPILDARRARAVSAWAIEDEVVLVGAGHPIGIPGGFDQCFPYRPHPRYRWLTEAHRPGSVLAFHEGCWDHFVPPITELERVWEGDSDVPLGRPRAELADWLNARTGKGVASLGCAVEETAGDAELSKRLGIALDHERRVKDATELERLRRAARVTAEGYAALSDLVRPGTTERRLQVEFEAAIGRAGAHGPGYATIIGTGPNSRVFHFTPGDREVGADDLVLVDAGAEVDGYVSDVTRTYPASGTWAGRQADVRAIVRAAQEAAFGRCRIGVRWSDVHRAAALAIAQGLVDLGLAAVAAEDFCSSEAIGLFLPHGVGHPVGRGVRDSGGIMPDEPEEPTVVFGARIRADLPLRAGYVMTVEPGLYFIPALLMSPEHRDKHAATVAWDRVDEWLDFGGLRLEDNLHITEDEPENLTRSIPW